MPSIRRRMRALFVAALSATALAVAGPAVSGASAEVLVNEGGGGEIALEGWYQLENIHCDTVSLEASLSGNGEINVHTVEAYSPTTWHQCNMLDDNNDEGGWLGQIVGPGEEGYLGNSAFEALIYPNFEYFGAPMPSPMRFGIEGTWAFIKSVVFPPGNWTMTGEMEPTDIDNLPWISTAE